MRGTMMNQNNNISRKSFKLFCKEYGLEKVGKKNIFVDSGKQWCYTPDNTTNSIRQLYDMTAGVCVERSGSLTFIERKDLKVGSVTRVSPDGTFARNAIYKL